MKAKHKNWSLQFFEIPIENEEHRNDLSYNVTKANIWNQCKHFGEFHHVSPFLQGNSENWMMIEFWCSSESLILKCCTLICENLNIEFDIE